MLANSKPIIRIFDTTLRDGEQSPGFSMNTQEKVQVAQQLDRLQVDVIEAGFPVTSKDDFLAVQAISEVVKNAEVCALARALEPDIQVAYESIKLARKPKIHTFIATSPIHREFKLKKSKDQIVDMAIKAVKIAKSLVPEVVFSPEDGSRTEKDYLKEVLKAVIEAGADVLNLADTVGYATPEEYQQLVKEIFEEVVKPWNNSHPDKEVWISTHCQNDLGMATAVSLAGVLGGAREIQCTINGIGERAGNASLEEVVMALKTRKDYYGFQTNIKTQELFPTSKLISTITGVPVQPNKAIVGINAFAHEAGIHQDGVLKNPETYEIMKPEDIGLKASRLVLGKHSGRHAIKVRLQELGFELEEAELEVFYQKFKVLADQKKQIYDADLNLLLLGKTQIAPFEIKFLKVTCGTIFPALAELSLLVEKNLIDKLHLEELTDSLDYQLFGNGEKLEIQTTSTGDGPIDASFKAINKILNIPNQLQEFSVNAVTEGIDATATVNLRLFSKDNIYTGTDSHTDIVLASCQAYLKALWKIQANAEKIENV